MESADANETYEDTIRPCDIDTEGCWVTARGHRVSVIGQHFETHEGLLWDTEEVQAISRAIDYIESCALCEEWVGKQVPLLHTVGHRILPCCACDQFVWLPRPDFEDALKEAMA